MLKELNNVKDGNKVNVSELMNKVTLNIIGLAGFGFDFTAFNPDPTTIGAKTYTAFQELIAKHSVVFAFIPFLKVNNESFILIYLNFNLYFKSIFLYQ